jgi:minor histocompatibility antigen H13
MVETGLIIAYGSLLTMACIPIYAGSFESLKGVKRPKNAAPRKKSQSPLDDSDSESESITESLSANDAWMFPVFGSGVLFSLYLLFRFLNKEYINYLLTGYFALLGCAAVAKVGLLVAKKTLPFSILKHVEKYKITISKQGKRTLFNYIDYIPIASIIDILLLQICTTATSQEFMPACLLLLSFSLSTMY